MTGCGGVRPMVPPPKGPISDQTAIPLSADFQARPECLTAAGRDFWRSYFLASARPTMCFSPEKHLGRLAVLFRQLRSAKTARHVVTISLCRIRNTSSSFNVSTRWQL